MSDVLVLDSGADTIKIGTGVFLENFTRIRIIWFTCDDRIKLCDAETFSSNRGNEPIFRVVSLASFPLVGIREN